MEGIASEKIGHKLPKTPIGILEPKALYFDKKWFDSLRVTHL